MTPEEACLLTAAHHGPTSVSAGDTISKPALTASVPFEPPQEPRPWPLADLPCTTPENSAGVWLFKDQDNAATHLVRNSLARGDEQLTHLSLSARGGLTRRMRDDTSAMYVLYASPMLTTASSSSSDDFGQPSRPPYPQSVLDPSCMSYLSSRVHSSLPAQSKHPPHLAHFPLPFDDLLLRLLYDPPAWRAQPG